MNMYLLYAILIALIPVVITIISSRLYNIIHGIITFIVMGFILTFCLQVFGANLPAELTAELPAVLALYTGMQTVVVDGLSQIGLQEVLTADYGVYILLGVYVLIYIISQIIACAIRKARVEKIKSLKRQVKRY